MRSFIVAATLVVSLGCTPVMAQSAAAPVAAQSKYSTADTLIGTLLDDPAARAVLDNHLPGFSSGDRISMARGMTLKAIQGFTSITDETLAKIDADLAKVPVQK